MVVQPKSRCAMAVSRYLEIVLGRRDALSDEERTVLRDISVERAAYRHEEVIIARGSAPARSCLLVKGMATREHLIGHLPQSPARCTFRAISSTSTPSCCAKSTMASWRRVIAWSEISTDRSWSTFRNPNNV